MRIIPCPTRPALLLAVLAVLCPAAAAIAQCGSGYGQRWFDRYYQSPRPYRYYYRYYNNGRYPSPYFRNSGRHLEEFGGSGLRYRRYHYPFSRYFEDRKTYPHTIDGQFGQPRRGDGLNLRFYQGPGFSPFSREQFFEAWYEDPPNPTAPDDVPPSATQGPGPAQRLLPDVVVQPAPQPQPEPQTEPQVVQAPVPPAPAVVRPPKRQARAAPPQRHSRERIIPDRVRPRPKMQTENRRAPLTRTPEEDRAWELLQRGKFESAQFAFCSVALAYPRNARPKAGFSLSIAMKDRHADAVFAMRRAFNVNPAPLVDMKVEDRLEQQLRKLLGYYTGTDHEVTEADALFMSGVLHLILGEEEAARKAVEDSFELGERNRSLLRLRIMLKMPDELRDQVPVKRKRRVRKDLTV